MNRPIPTRIVIVALAAAGFTGCTAPDGGGVFGGGSGGGGGAGGGSDGAGGRATSSSKQASASSGEQAATSTKDASATSSSGGGCEPSVEFTCNDGTCVILQWVCDGFGDCPDASDEAPINPQCSSVVSSSVSTGGCNDFLCSDGGCVPLAYVCDAIPDCLDGSDEIGCKGPEGWNCSSTFYGSGDGCDCGCGILDPDCDTSGVESCVYCTNAGSCAASCDDIHPDQNWRCVG
jgi:hypothetical protein